MVFSNTSSIAPLSCLYYDDKLTFRQRNVAFEQGFNFNQIEALKDLEDNKVNNYSSLYLTNFKYFRDIFQLPDLEFTYAEIPTFLAANTLLKIDDSTKFLVFRTSSDESRNGIYPYSFQTLDNLTFEPSSRQGEGIKIGTNRYFVLELFGYNKCRIKFNYRNTDFYLTYNETTGKFCFAPGLPISELANQNIGQNIFICNIDSQGFVAIRYKSSTGTIYRIKFENDQLVTAPLLSAATIVSDFDDTFAINFSRSSAQFKEEQNWVEYIQSQINQLNIDSTVTVKNSFLLSFQYTDIAQNIVIANCLMLDNTKGKPISIATGSNQEKGDQKITLNYTCNTQLYTFKPGETIFFTPSSLAPYSQININDSDFSNGAIAGNSPLTSDSVYHIQKDTYNDTGVYLCTWLSAGDTNTWVDRYYYSDKISRNQALSSSGNVKPTIITNIESQTIPNIVNTNYAVYDIRSDMCFVPNSTYIYKRLGSLPITETNLTTHLLSSGVSNPQLWGNKYASLNFPDSFNQGFITQFDIHDHDSTSCYILGNYLDTGWGLIQKQPYTPFIIIPQEDTIVCYNTDGVLLYSTQLDSTITNIARSDNFESYFVSTLYYLYSISLNGAILRQTAAQNINSLYVGDEVYALVNNEALVFNKITLQQSASALIPKCNTDLGINSIFFRTSAYGLVGKHVQIKDSNTVFYTYDDYSIVEESLTTNRSELVFTTQSRIYDFCYDDGFAIAHGSKFSLYDKNRNLINSFALSGIGVSVDKVKELTPSGVQSYFTLFEQYNGQTWYHKISGQFIESKKLNVSITDCNFKPCNYNRVKDTSSTSFKLLLINPLDNTDIIVDSFDVSFDVDWTNYVFAFDPIKGKASLYQNFELVHEVNFDPQKYRLSKTPKSANFTIGAFPFYGDTLDMFLKQPRYYYTQGIVTKNIQLYKGCNSVQPFITKFEPLETSLPAGAYTNQETIQNFYKFGIQHKTNAIDIVVKNAQIRDQGVKKLMETDLRQNALKFLPATVTINNVSFVNYHE